jgi:hypothetical protein
MLRSFGVLALTSFALAACGGGGSGSTAVPGRGGTTSPASTQAKLTITIPRGPAPSSRTRRPRYISSKTQSATIFALGVSTTLLLTTANPNCVQGATLVCTVEFPVPTGNSTITISTFASTEGSGTPLSTSTVPVTASPGVVNSLSITLNGVVAAVKLVDTAQATNPQVTTGSSRTDLIDVFALDAAGATIIGPGTFSDASGNPVTITVTDSDTSGATSLSSPTSFTAPSADNTVTLHYNGANIPDFTISASASGATPSSLAYHVNVAPQVLYVGESPCDLRGNPTVSTQEYAVPASGALLGGSFASLTQSGTAAVAYSGDLFIQMSNSIGHFAPDATGNTPPVATFTLPQFQARILAVDSSLGVWAAGSDTTAPFTPRLLHFPPNSNGTGVPDRNVTGLSGLPTALAFDALSLSIDSHDNVYTVAEQPNGTQARVYVLSPSADGNAVVPIASYPHEKPATKAALVAVDRHTDTVITYPRAIYAGGTPVAPAPGATPLADTGIVTYPRGSQTPSRVIYNSTDSVRSVAMDDRGYIYAVYWQIGVCQGDARMLTFAPTDNGSTPGTLQQQPRSPYWVTSRPLTTPAPASGGSGPPNPAISPSPSSMAFLASGARYSQTLTVTETGYSGTFTATSANTAIATVGPAGPPNTFTVSPVDAGTTTITVRDSSGGYSTVSVTVSITGVGLSSSRRL